LPWDESTNPEYSKRLLHGHQIIEKSIEPKQVAPNSFEIPSQSKDLNYIVTHMLTLGAALAPIISSGM
jgi:hypothetical protein